MKKSLKSLKNIELLSKEEMQTVKGGGVMGSSYNTFCEWYANLTGQSIDDMLETPIGQFMYRLDVALGLG